jgi:hypothetical protein
MKLILTIEIPAEKLLHFPLKEYTHQSADFTLSEHMCKSDLLDRLIAMPGSCKCYLFSETIVEFTPDEIKEFKHDEI